jgi:hypothetical protein
MSIVKRSLLCSEKANAFPLIRTLNNTSPKSKSNSKLLYGWQSVCLGIEYPCGTCDQILFPVGMLLFEICGLVSMGHPLWREDGSAICGVITQWSESLRTRNHTLLSHLRLHQPGGPGSRIYIPQEQGGPVIPPGTGFPLCRLLRLTGLRWRFATMRCKNSTQQYRRAMVSIGSTPELYTQG